MDSNYDLLEQMRNNIFDPRCISSLEIIKTLSEDDENGNQKQRFSNRAQEENNNNSATENTEQSLQSEATQEDYTDDEEFQGNVFETFEESINRFKNVKTMMKKEFKKILRSQAEALVYISVQWSRANLLKSRKDTLSKIRMKKNDSTPDGKVKLERFKNYKISMKNIGKIVDWIAQDQIKYLRFLDKFSNFVLTKGEPELFGYYEGNLTNMNDLINILINDRLSRAFSKHLSCYNELKIAFRIQDNPREENYDERNTNENILKEESRQFAFDMKQSAKDYITCVKREVDKYEELRKSHQKTLQKMLIQLYTKEGLQFPNKGVRVSSYSFNTEVFERYEDDMNASNKSEEIGTLASTLYNGSLKFNLQTLLKNWNTKLHKIFKELSSGHKQVLNTYDSYFKNSQKNSKLQIKKYKRQYLREVRYEQRHVLFELCKGIKKISSNASEEAAYPSAVDLLDFQDPNYPHNKYRVLDSYKSRIRANNTQIINTISHFSLDFFKVEKESLKKQFETFKFNPSHKSLEMLRLHNVQKMDSMIHSFTAEIKTLINDAKSILMDLCGRLTLDMFTNFESIVVEYELKMRKNNAIFTQGVQETIIKYDQFVRKCCNINEELILKRNTKLKSVVDEIHESLVDFSVASPILQNKAASEGKVETVGAIESFLTKTFSKIHSTFTPDSLLQMPSLLRKTTMHQQNNSNEEQEIVIGDERNKADDDCNEVVASRRQIAKSDLHFEDGFNKSDEIEFINKQKQTNMSKINYENLDYRMNALYDF